jgi:hypothetical protein
LSHSFLPGGSESMQAKVKRLELIVKMECGPESGDEGAPTRVWHSVLSLLPEECLHEETISSEPTTIYTFSLRTARHWCERS